MLQASFHYIALNARHAGKRWQLPAYGMVATARDQEKNSVSSLNAVQKPSAYG
jgi:hypothetical protein